MQDDHRASDWQANDVIPTLAERSRRQQRHHSSHEDAQDHRPVDAEPPCALQQIWSPPAAQAPASPLRELILWLLVLLVDGAIAIAELQLPARGRQLLAAGFRQGRRPQRPASLPLSGPGLAWP